MATIKTTGLDGKTKLDDGYRTGHGVSYLRLFKRLWNCGNGALDLTNSDDHPHYYSGDQADDIAFFFVGQLNAVLTPRGLSYWGLLRIETNIAAVGLPQA